MNEALTFDRHQFIKYLMDNGFTDGLRLAGRGEKIHAAMRADLRAIESDAVGAFNIAGGAPVRTGGLFRAAQAACGTNLTAAAGPATSTKGDLKLVRNKVETGEIIP